MRLEAWSLKLFKSLLIITVTEMKKTFYIIALGLLWLVWFTRADVDSMNVAPATQSAISGSTVTFTVTGHNGTGDTYLKYVLPKTAAYDIIYQNSNLTPINNWMLSMWGEHDPVFYIPANSNFSVTITAKTTTTNRSLPTIDPICNVPANVLSCSLELNTCPSQCTNVPIVWIHIASDMQFSTLLHSLMSWITPVSDLAITNILTGENPSVSWDIVSYFITLQNIWSTSATGISFISNFPIPKLAMPTATFNGLFHSYTYINYPQDFVWTGSYLNTLNPGQSITILLSAPMMQSFAVGTTFNQIAKTATTNSEYSTTNNTAAATGIVQAAANVWVTKTLNAFTGYRAGDKVVYTITYGNSWGKSASNVVITDLVPAWITLPVTSFTIGTLPAGSGGTLVVTWTLNATLASWTTFANTANISTTSFDSATGNNSSTATGIVQGIANINLNITANNLTRPQYNTSPYGSWSDSMIQAISGDTVQLTITYANRGNVVANNATLLLSWIQWFFTTASTFNETLSTIAIDYTGTIILTGIVGPKNYVTFSPTASLYYNNWMSLSDNVVVQEPMICGDWLLTKTESCDTQGNLGVEFSGQVCENQQGMCVLVTQSIINNACINYQYANPLGGMITGQACSSVNTALMNASCSTMTGSEAITTSNGYDINFTCTANNAASDTPISIDCGNGTSVSWTWTITNGTCSYATSFIGNAQCRVGSDITNVACRVPVPTTQMQCDLEALDGRIILVDTDNSEWEGRFRCETRDDVVAQELEIDCGESGVSDQWWRYATATNTSQLETVCSYDENTLPQNKQVTCSTNSVICETENIIVDEPTLWYCGDGIVEWYEDCDDGDDNGTSASSCSVGCDLEGAEMVGCFNVGNMNISIQKWDLLPFRWMLDQEENIIAWSTCEDKPDGKIPEESLYCTFSVYNGDHQEADGDPLYTFTKKCNENNRNWSLFNYFTNQANQIWSLKDAFGKYAIDSSNFVDSTFGEYKIVLEKVKYNYCRSDDKEEWTEIDRVCSVNFTVTQPYLAQKSSFGLTPKATNISLDGYQTLNGEELIKSTDLDDIMVLDDSDYDGGSTVRTMMDSFITKYNKLAITVDNQYLPSSLKNLGITVKVIPNQKIYILQSDTRKTITMKDITSFNAPFTIVTKNIDVIIKGNVEYNGMFLVKNGTITFEKSDETVAWDRCPGTQTVKGIFVTDEWFLGGTPLNNMANNKERCNYGWLYVKGILIGNDIENIVEAKRSQLNHWFYVWWSSDAAVKAERRNEIFNGAAVLIEYSPSLWNALPPGASEFTTALDIYKQ